jgi:hypothetical protein
MASGGATRLLRFRFLAFQIGTDLQLIEGKALLEPLLANKLGRQFNGPEMGDGELIPSSPARFEGVVSKTVDAPDAPGSRGLWRKEVAEPARVRHLGWSDPEGSRPHLGALLLSYYAMTPSPPTTAVWAQYCLIRFLADLRRRFEPLSRV